MKSYFFLVLALVLSINSLSFADVFTFGVRGYPKKERNCHSQTNEIAEEFEKGTQTKVVHVECVGERQTGYDFSIEYEAARRLDIVSTDYHMNFVENSGRYAKQSDCLTNLPFQSQLFESATGLKPFFSYCRSLELEVGKNWEVILFAQGKASSLPQLSGFLMFAPPTTQILETLKKGLNSALKSQGAMLADLVLHYSSVMGTGSGSIHYFSPKRLEFHLERISQVPNLDSCLAQAKELEQALGPISPEIFGIYCGKHDWGFYDLHLGFINPPSFTWLKSVDVFTSLSDCEQNRLEVLKHYEGSAMGKLLVGICSRNYDDQKYQVVMFRARKT